MIFINIFVYFVIAFSSSIFFISLFACPDFSGNYICTDETETYNQKVIQENLLDRTILTVESNEGVEKIIIDNNWHPADLGQDAKNAKYKALCFDDYATTEAVGDYYAEGNFVGPFTMNTKYFHENNNFVSETDASVAGTSLPKSTTVCKKQ